MDKFNPFYEDFEEGKIKDVFAFMKAQNHIYGAQHWYPLLKDVTPTSYLFELSEEHIEKFSDGIVPDDFYFVRFVLYLISQGYEFVKTTHKSAHAFKPVRNWQDFEEQLLNASVIMSFRNYRCPFLMFRQWTEMKLECRVYVFEKQVRYAEVYRDENKEFEPTMFSAMISFVTEQVIPRLSPLYDSFTADVYFADDIAWQVIEINSPCWLKAGLYNIRYEWEKDRIHSTSTPICRYTDKESGEVIEV